MSRLAVASEIRRWIVLVGAGLGLLFVVSFWAGHCRNWKEEHQTTKILAGKVERGKFIERTTLVPVEVEIRVPVVSDDRRAEMAEKFEVDLPPAETTDVASTGEPEAPSRLIYPLIVVPEQTFGPGPAGDRIDCSVWQLFEGAPLDQRCRWKDYKPERQPEDRWFQNVAKVRWALGGGLVAVGEGLGPGALLSGEFSGFRTGRATWNVQGVALVNQHGGAAFAGLSVSWP